MLHVHDPLSGKMSINPLDVAVNVINITLRHILERIPRFKLLHQMENGPEQVGKLLMLQEALVFQKVDQKTPFFNQKFFQTKFIAVTGFNFNVAIPQIFECPRKFLLLPCSVYQ